ncbi:hypothetical protein B484DRAFT_459012, partial [Ochromonadaceae sp. CCMP2298]
TMRHVFVNSIILDDNTTATALALYDTMNRVNPGLESLTIYGDVTFPKDIAVRSAKTLHTLVITDQGTAQLRKLMGSVREWGNNGGSLHKLRLEKCKFGNEAVDFGSCDALTKLYIQDCSSTLCTTPGDSLGCTRLLWGILPKCKNLKKFTKHSLASAGVEFPLNDLDLCLLARFCPHLTLLSIYSPPGTFNEAALVSVAMKCTKLETLRLLLKTALSDRTIEAVAANLVSLQVLFIKELQLDNPRTLRLLAHSCPNLQKLCIYEGNMAETELLYLVESAKKLQVLTIGKWKHLDLRERWEIQPFAAEDLLQLGIVDPEALLSSQRDRLQVLKAPTQQAGDTDTADRLQAASSHPRFKVKLQDW